MGLPHKYIVFVHGWRWQGNITAPQDCEETFKLLWLCLKQDFHDCDAKYFNYKTGIINPDLLANILNIEPSSPYKEDFFYSSEALKNFLYEIKVDYSVRCKQNPNEQNELKIALIGHSAGGLVIRHALSDPEIPLDRELINFIKHITLIASPSQGCPILPKQIDQPWLRAVFTEQFIQLSDNSVFTEQVNQYWQSFASNTLQNFELRCLYASDDIWAPRPNDSSLDPIAITISNCNHNNILRDSQTCEYIKEFLRAVGF